ncbi:MAG: DPP IV N-terminal domain-containing protein, partial [Planctomycetaceae bacterium]
MRHTIFFLAIAFLTGPAVAQSLRLNWAKDNSRLWFRDRSGGTADFFVVDVETRQKVPAFDPERLAAAISVETSQKLTPETLQVNQLGFTEDPDEIVVNAAGREWVLNLRSYELAKPTSAEAATSRFFLPPRDSGPSNKSTNIEIKNQLDKPIQIVWIDPRGGHRSYGKIAPGQVQKQHTYVGHVWMFESHLGHRLGCFSARVDDRISINSDTIKSVRRHTSRPTRRRRVTPGQYHRGLRSPNREYTGFVRDQNLWLRSDDGEKQLSQTGSKENPFSRTGKPAVLQWSPDSKFVVAFQTKSGTDRSVHLVESTPSDQLQPKLQSYSYRKPGDDLDQQTLRLYSLEKAKEVAVSNELFSNPWSLRFDGWSPSGDSFYLRYNQRGHQVVRFLEVTTDGDVRPIIEEKSPTFIHYSGRGKSVFESLGADELLWASERSGWNHLYRYSLKTRELLNPVTSGDWNVKRITRVDRKANRVWFYAVGVYENQDPYHEHFCRVNFDGSGFKVLTEGDGTHSIQFEQNDQYFIDTYSRVDLAPVAELRDSESGERIAELSRADTKARFGKRRLTERFVAKGRDGKTDIWGIIHWPRDFDPDKKYPVVENIYAGPHDHHVPKSFRERYGHQHRI